jgi:hypothetical protein
MPPKPLKQFMRALIDFSHQVNQPRKSYKTAKDVYGDQADMARTIQNAKHSDRMRARHKDPVYRAKQAKRSKEVMERLNSNPEFVKAREASREKSHEKRLLVLKRNNADPEFNKRRREAIMKRNADPEFRKRSSERMKAMWAAKKAAGGGNLKKTQGNNYTGAFNQTPKKDKSE